MYSNTFSSSSTAQRPNTVAQSPNTNYQQQQQGFLTATATRPHLTTSYSPAHSGPVSPMSNSSNGVAGMSSGGGGKPFPPLPEDDSDDEFILGLRGDATTVATTNKNAAPTSLSAAMAGNTTNASGGGNSTAPPPAAGVRPPGLLTRREQQTLDEFEELMAMGGDTNNGPPPPPSVQPPSNALLVNTTNSTNGRGGSYVPPTLGPLNGGSTSSPNNNNSQQQLGKYADSMASSESEVEGTESDDDYDDDDDDSEDGRSPHRLRGELKSGTHSPTMSSRREFAEGADHFGSLDSSRNQSVAGGAARGSNTSSYMQSTRKRRLLGGGLRKRRLKPIKISKYLLGAVMGQGVTCTVRDAIDMSRNTLERVAVKMLKRPEKKLSRMAPADRAHIERMIETEVEMLQRFHHPNVMRALDCFTREGKEYVVMPIAVCSLQDFIAIRVEEMRRRQAEGHNSASVSRTHSLNAVDAANSNRNPHNPSASHHADDRFSSRVLAPATLVKDIILQVLSGVAYLHSQKVYHNDLKPSNILLFGDGTLRISDLGCSGSAFDVGRHGTPAFVSPQVVAHLVGHENPGLVSASEPLDPSKNDAWACGVILYQLLTGRLPYGHQEDAPPSSPASSLGGGAGNAEDFILDDDDDLGLGGGMRRTTPPPNNSSRRGLYQPQVNEFTVYRDIVHMPIDYDRVFEEGDADGGASSPCSSRDAQQQQQQPPTPSALRGLGKGSASGKSLLMGLLNKNQSERLSIAAALQHPWLQEAVRRAPLLGSPDYIPPAPVLDPTLQPPKAPGVGPLNSSVTSMTSLRRLFDVSEIKAIIEEDFRRHIQHVAEVCFIIRMELPPRLFKVPYNKDTRPILFPPTRAVFSPTPSSCLYESVNGSKFLSDEAMRYYALKGRPDCDIATLRNQPQRRVHFYLYVDGLVRLCEELGHDNEQLSGNGGSAAGKKLSKNSSITNSFGFGRGSSASAAGAAANGNGSSAAGAKGKEAKAGGGGGFWCC